MLPVFVGRGCNETWLNGNRISLGGKSPSASEILKRWKILIKPQDLRMTPFQLGTRVL